MSRRSFAIVPLLAAMTLGYFSIGCDHDHDHDDGHHAGFYQGHDYDHSRYDDQTNYDRHQYDRDFH